MKHLAPAVFRDFVCAASACPDSCCRAGWEIVIDPETLNRYEALPGPDGDRVRAAVVHGAEPLLRQDADRVCVLLDGDGLCHAQRKFGHGSLCRVCREYPRFHREFGNLTEHGVSLSCPTAFRLAVSQPPRLIEWEDDAPIVPNDLDPERYLLLREGRTLALALLEDESRPLWERLILVRALALRLQRGLDGGKRVGKTACRLRSRIGQEAAIRRALAQNGGLYGTASRFAPHPPLRGTFPRGGRLRDRAENPARLGALAEIFAGLEILSPEWREGLEAFRKQVRLAGGHCKRVQRRQPGGLSRTIAESFARSDMPCLWAASPLRRVRGAEAEVYARYLWYSLFKYWLDAADDGLLLARVKRSFAMTELGLAMDRLVPREESWLRRISREIEHCEENLEALLEIL